MAGCILLLSDRETTADLATHATTERIAGWPMKLATNRRGQAIVDQFRTINGYRKSMSEDESQALAEACAAALWDADTTTQSLGMVLRRIAPGACELQMTVTEKMCNGHGTCHGGYLFTLADSAFAFACNSYNQRSVAHHCNITYVSPSFTGDQLTAVATEVSRAGRNGIYDIQITNQQNAPVAVFRGHSRTVKGTLVSDANAR